MTEEGMLLNQIESLEKKYFKAKEQGNMGSMETIEEMLEEKQAELARLKRSR